jgi:phospholipid/cholesterol/gamma-HCH transport system substrate-binding protein
MKLNRFEIWVGFFVVLGIASLLMLALQVSGLSNFYNTESGYEVKASFANIGGLKVRSKVTISGVTVGRVVSIALDQNQYGEYNALVTLSINDHFNKIPEDSSAKILTAGLLGDNYIGIVPGQAEEYLKNGSTLELTSQAMLLEDLISKFAVGGEK